MVKSGRRWNPPAANPSAKRDARAPIILPAGQGRLGTLYDPLRDRPEFLSSEFARRPGSRRRLRDPRLTVEAQQAIRERFGLTMPVINCFQSLNPPQLGDCAVNPLDTQFFIYREPGARRVRHQLPYQSAGHRDDRERLWNTLILIGAGQILAIIFGMSLGVLAAWARTPIDFGAPGFSLLAWSLPTFWLGIILLFWGSTYLGLPIGGKLTPGMTYANAWEYLWTSGATCSCRRSRTPSSFWASTCSSCAVRSSKSCRKITC